MVPRNQLSPPRQKLLNTSVRRDDYPGLTQVRLVSQRTVDEMKAGREAIAEAVAEQCASAGKIMLQKRYANTSYSFVTTVSKSAVEEMYYIKLSVFDLSVLDKNSQTRYPPFQEPVFQETELAHKFISELLLTKIIMVVG